MKKIIDFFRKKKSKYHEIPYSNYTYEHYQCLNVKARQRVSMDIDEDSIRLNLARTITNQLLQDGLIEFYKENYVSSGKCSITYMANLKVLKRER